MTSEIKTEQLLLNRVLYAAQGQISRQMLDDTSADVVLDQFTNSLVVRLRRYVLSDKVADWDAAIPWSEDVEVEVEVDRDNSSLPFLQLGVAGVCALMTPILGPGAFAAALLVALVTLIWIVRAPVPGTETQTVRVSGTVVVPVEQRRNFPEATIRYPDSLGMYVQVTDTQEPYFAPRLTDS